MLQNKLLKMFKLLPKSYLNYSSFKPSSLIFLQRFYLHFDWIVKVFNWKDKERVKLVGPDCACAEWLLRNGASVRFKGEEDLLSDYNELIALEEIDTQILKVEEVYAKEAYLHQIGFDHFIGCDYVKKITFISCPTLTDSALFQLIYVKKSLEHLELRSCRSFKDAGLDSLGKLSNLKTLILADLTGVKNKDKCEEVLRNALPQCKIDYQK